MGKACITHGSEEECIRVASIFRVKDEAGNKLCLLCNPADGDDVFLRQITRRYIPKDRTLDNHRCENLRSYVFKTNLKEYLPN
jgi:hypothetical protein